jgi:superfamily II DNA or RNA helicase
MAALRAVGASAWPSGLTCRGWYQVAVNRWRVKMHGIVEIPEGRTRVRFALLCLREFRRRYPAGGATIVVSTLGDVDLWSVSLDDYGVPTDEVASVSAREHPSSSRCATVVVVNSARQLAHLTQRKAQRLLIVDDCQRAPSLENVRILAGLSTATLGLASRALGSEGIPALQITTLLGPVVCRSLAPVSDRGSGASSLNLINVKVNLSSAERARYDLITSRAAAMQTLQRPGLGTWGAKRRRRLLNLRSALLGRAWMRLQVAAKIVDQHRGDRAIVLHDIAGSAQALGELLRRRRHRVSVWHSALAPAERRENLRRFRTGAADVLIASRGASDLTYLSPGVVGVVVTPGDRPSGAIRLLRSALRGRRDHRAVLYTLFMSEDERRRLGRAATSFPKTRVFWRAGGR